MSEQALLDLNARLVDAEVHAGVGKDWFASWLEMLRSLEGTSLYPELDTLARRLDAILQAAGGHEKHVEGVTGTASEKRPQSELDEASSSQPIKKTSGVDTAVATGENAASSGDTLAQKEDAGIPAEIEQETISTEAAPVPEEATPMEDEAAILPVTEVKSIADPVVAAPLSELPTGHSALQPAKPADDLGSAQSDVPLTLEKTAGLETSTGVAEQANKELDAPAPTLEMPTSKLAAFLSAVEPPRVAPPSSPGKPSSPSVGKVASASSPSVGNRGTVQASSIITKPPSPSGAGQQVAAASKPPASPASSSMPAPSASVSPPAALNRSASPSAAPTSIAGNLTAPSPSNAQGSPAREASPTTSTSGSSAAASTVNLDESAKQSAVKQSEGGHMEVSQAAFDLFQEVKIRKKHRYVIFRVQDWKLEIVKVGDRSATFDDFMKELPFSDCRFAVYDHEKMKSDQYGNRKAEKVFFVTWQPVPAPTTQKMLYSTERRTLTAVFTGVEEIVATKRDDVLVATGVKDKFADEDSEDEERGGKDDWMDD